VVEQRYQAVLAVLADGRTVAEVAGQWSVSRQTVHSWLACYETAGLSGLVDRSHRPVSCPHQLGGEVVEVVLALRRSRPYWGPRRLVLELVRKGIDPVPSESAVYRALVRAGMAITPLARSTSSHDNPTASPRRSPRIPMRCHIAYRSSAAAKSRNCPSCAAVHTATR